MTRPRGLGWAAALALFAAVVSWSVVDRDGIPHFVISALAGQETGLLELHGGVRIRYAVADGDAETARRAAEVITRRAEGLASSARVVATGDRVDVELPGLPGDGASALATHLIGRGELTFKRVVHDSEVTRGLYQAVQGRPDAGGVRGSAVWGAIDRWHHEEGSGEYRDHYLAAYSRDDLVAYLAGWAERDQALAAQPGHEFVIEHVRSSGFDEFGDHWRTYYVASQSILVPDAVAAAHLQYDPTTGRPVTAVELTPRAARQFADYTSQHRGEKLAFLLDDSVVSVPVIQGAITGGRVQIAPGAGSREHAMRAVVEAIAAAARQQDPPPEGLEVARVEVVPASASARQLHGARALVAVFLGLAVFALALLVVRVVRPLDLAVAASAERPAWYRGGGRLAVTLGVGLAVYPIPALFILPGVDEAAFGALVAGYDPDIAPYLDTLRQISVFALGLGPILSAFVVVELIVLAVPRWRPLRIGGPAGRAGLGRATAVVAVLFAGLQGYLLAVWLQGMAADASALAIVPHGMAARLVITASLVAGSLVYWLLAMLVSRYGLGNGVSVVLLWGLVAAVIHGDVWSVLGLDAGQLVALLAVVALTIAATRWLLTARVGGDRGFRLPTCGAVPISNAGALMGLALALAALGVPLDGALEWIALLDPAAGHHAVYSLGLLAVLAVAFSWLFSRPRRLLADAAQVVRHGDAGSRRGRAFWIATAVSTASLVALAAVYTLDSGHTGLFLGLEVAMLLTAITMDLVTELRARRRRGDLVSVWPVHRVQMIDLAVSALAGAGIDVHARGQYHRALLFFFGPFIPVELMVPRDRAVEAGEILAALSGTAPPA